MLQENKYPFLNVVFNSSPSLDYFVPVDIYKLCIFTSVRMTHASVTAASVSLPGLFLFGTLELVGFFELITLLPSLEGRSPAACLFACCGVCFLSKPELR